MTRETKINSHYVAHGTGETLGRYDVLTGWNGIERHTKSYKFKILAIMKAKKLNKLERKVADLRHKELIVWKPKDYRKKI